MRVISGGGVYNYHNSVYFATLFEANIKKDNFIFQSNIV